MRKIEAIIKTLSKKEITFIQSYYNNNEEKKRLTLFNGILKNKFKTDEDASVYLYTTKGASYSQLKKRLKEDLYNLMVFFDSEKNLDSKLVKATLKINKMLLQVSILSKRELRDEAFLLLEKCLKLAIQYELIKEKVNIIHLYGTMFRTIKNVNKKFNAISENFLTDTNDLKCYYNSFYYRTNSSIFNTDRKNSKKSQIKFSFESYKKQKKIHQESTLITVVENYYLAAIKYYLLIRDFSKTYDYSKKLNVLVKNNIEINTTLREVISLISLYTSSINLKKYKESTAHASEAYQIISNSFLKDTRNEIIVLSYLYRSNLRENSTEDLLFHLERGFKHPQIKLSKKYEEEWVMYKALYHFRMKDYKETLYTLNNIVELIKNKSGWLFSFKLLEIMAYIETEDFDMVFYRIDTFRKLLYKKENEDLTRIQAIHKIFKCLLKLGFDFKKTAVAENENLSLLQEGKDDYYWNPEGYEHIRFDDWFTSHIK